MRDEADPAPVIGTTPYDEGVIVETEDGGTSKISQEYWEFVDELRASDDVTLEAGDDALLFAQLPDGSDVVVAPRVED